MLQATGLHKSFGDRAVITGIDLDVRQGEFMALLGPSGSGKTTVLRLIAGFEDADAGEIRVGGRIVVHDLVNVPPERRKIGMVFQDYALFPHLSVRDNVAFGIGRTRGKDARVREVLERVGLGPFMHQMPHVLSGGQQQRVALARALAPNPTIVLLDEPFSNLDPALRGQVRADVRRILQEAGVTAILVTHDQEEALSIADRIAVMFDGHIEQLATPEDVYHRPASREVAAFIGDAQFVRGSADGSAVDTELGRLELLEAREGPVDVLIRPEMIALAPFDESPAPISGTIINRRFFGRDQQVDVQLMSGSPITARTATDRSFAAGQQVSVSVTRPVLAFSADGQP